MNWRWKIHPMWLRAVIVRVWPGRWTQQEVDEIMMRAKARAAWFEENVE